MSSGDVTTYQGPLRRFDRQDEMGEDGKGVFEESRASPIFSLGPRSTNVAISVRIPLIFTGKRVDFLFVITLIGFYLLPRAN